MKKLTLTLIVLFLAVPVFAQVSVTVTVVAVDVALVEDATIDVSNPKRLADGLSAETLQQYMQRVLDSAVARWKAQAINVLAEANAEVYRTDPTKRTAIDNAAAGR